MSNIIAYEIKFKGTDKQAKELGEIEKEIRKLTTANKELTKTGKEDYALREKNLQAIKGLRDAKKRLIKTQNAEKGSINQLNDANKKLREHIRNINGGTKLGAERIARYNRAIDKNTASIKRQSDSMIKQKMDIGNYRIATKDLTNELKKNQTALINVEKEIKSNGDNLKDNEKKLKKLIAEQKKYGGSTASNEKKLEILNNELRKNTSNTKRTQKRLKGLREEQVRYNKEITTSKTKLRLLNAEAKKQNLSLNNNINGLKGSIASMGKLVVGIGLGIAGFRTLQRVMGGVISIIADYEEANDELASVLQTTSDKITQLTDDSIRLGGATKYTSKEVANMQTVLARAGYGEQQILDTTESVLLLAQALKVDLSASADLATSTMAMFGIDTSDATHTMEVLGIATTKSKLDFEKLAVALPYVGSSAKALGIGLEETVALMGKLADSGLPAQKIGTGLRGVFVEMAKSGRSLDDVLGDVTKSTSKTKTAFQIFKKAGATAALTLAENRDKSNELTESLKGLNGELKTMADNQLDNLKGDKLLLTSAWEGFVLSVDNGSGVISTTLRGITQGFTSILQGLQDSEINIVDFYHLLKTGQLGTFESKKRLDEQGAEWNKQQQKRILAELRATSKTEIELREKVFNAKSQIEIFAGQQSIAEYEKIIIAQLDLFKEAKTQETEVTTKATAEELEAIRKANLKKIEEEKKYRQELTDFIHRFDQKTQAEQDEENKNSRKKMNDLILEEKDIENEKYTEQHKTHIKSIDIIDQESTDKRIELAWYESEEKTKAVKDYFDAIGGMASAGAKLQGALQNASFVELDIAMKKEIEVAGENAEKKALIEETYAEKKKEIQKKQALLNLGLTISEIISTAALASLNVWTAQPVATAPFLYAAVGANTIASLIDARSQYKAVMSLGKGGILKGDSHSAPSGGIPVGDTGIMVEGNEPVLTANVTRNPLLLQQASDINVQAGGDPLVSGRRIMARGGLLPTTTVDNGLDYGRLAREISRMKIVTSISEINSVNNRVQNNVVDISL